MGIIARTPSFSLQPHRIVEPNDRVLSLVVSSSPGSRPSRTICSTREGMIFSPETRERIESIHTRGRFLER